MKFLTISAHDTETNMVNGRRIYRNSMVPAVKQIDGKEVPVVWEIHGVYYANPEVYDKIFKTITGEKA